MDIVVTLLLAFAICAVSLLAGLLLADRAERKRALAEIAAERTRLQELLTKISAKHNELVTECESFKGKLEAIGMRVLSSNAGRPGPTQGAKLKG